MRVYNLLIVENETYELYLIRKVLEQEANLHLFITSDSKTAVNMLERYPMDLVISAQGLPGISGLQFMERVQQHSPRTMRILMSGQAEAETIRCAYDHGLIQHFLTKPCNEEVLRITVKNALTQYRMEADRRSMERRISEMSRKQQHPEEIATMAALKKRFMMVANHELRTPATIISASLDILAERKDNLNEVQKKFVATALGGAKRLNELLDRVFTLLEYEQHKIVLDEKPLELAALAKEVCTNYRDTLLRRHINLQLAIPEGLPVRGYRPKLELLFDNLFSNALKYTPDGGTIKVYGRSEGERALLVVEDNGIGIPANELENIFGSFYQLGNPLHHHSSREAFMGSGVGIGLTLCRSIVQSHRGEIWAESEGPGGGSRFCVRLPMSAHDDVRRREADSKYLQVG